MTQYLLRTTACLINSTFWCTLQRIECLFYLVSDSSVIMNSTNCYLVTLKVKAKKAEYNTNLFRIKCVQYWQWHKLESHLKIWISGCAPKPKSPPEPPKQGKFQFISSFFRVKNQLNVFEKKNVLMFSN